MPTFGRLSRSRQRGVHPALVEWSNELVIRMDCSVISGVRTVEQQRIYVDRGVSKTMDSLHLPQADGFSHAIDLAPYPIDWKDLKRFYVLIGFGLMLAEMLSLPITNGRDWDGDLDFDDQEFNDFTHWQIPRNFR